MESLSSGSVLSQLQHQIGELHADPHINGHDSTGNDNGDHHGRADDDDITNANDDDESGANGMDDADGSAAVVAAAAGPTPSQPVNIDLSSEELFPSLPAAPAGKPLPAWRAPPVATSAAKQNGANAGTVAKRLGKVSERLEIQAKDQAKLPSNGKGSIWDVTKLISLKTQTTIDFTTHRTTNALNFTINGKADAVKLARRELVAAVGAQKTETLHVPASVRPHLLGSGGKNLKALTAETSTRISIPKPAEGAPVRDNSVESFEEDDDQVVTITGDFEGVRIAKERIEAEVAKRTSKLSLRVPIERSFHPFIAGFGNATVNQLQEETSTRIHIPPLAPGAVLAEKNLNEIIIIGDRDAVRSAEERLKSLYENLKRTTRTLSFPVKKRQHRFIIGPKGSTLQEILQQTGCSVELPLASDPSENVTVRGPDTNLSAALQAVLQKANETQLEEIEVVPLLPKATDAKMFMKYLFTKERAELRKVETAHNVAILQITSPAGQPIIEIQGKTRGEVDAARTEATGLLKEWGASLFFGDVEIPRGLHRYVVGKGGQNIVKMKSSPVWEGRLVDVVVPNEDAESDDVLLVVRRQPSGLGGAPNVKAPKGNRGEAAAAASDAEVQAFVEKVRDEILAVTTAQADFVNETIPVPSKFHGRLIGSGGASLKELLAPYGNDVSIKFPALKKENGDDKESVPANNQKKKDVDPNTITLKGPKKNVAELKAKVEKLVADMKHVEVISSFSDNVKVGKGLAKKVLSGINAAGPTGSGDRGQSGGIGWLIRLIKENLSAPVHGKVVPLDGVAEQALMNLRVEVNDADEVITIYGPKNAVVEAKAILTDRAQGLADQTSIDVKLFEEVSKEAQQVLRETQVPDLKRRILRRLIGTGGKEVKQTMERHGVYVQFPRRGGKGRRSAAAPEADEPEEEEEVDEAAEAEGLVIIKGNKKHVQAAKTELLATVEKEIIKSFVLTFQIPRSVLRHLVGSQGSRINKMKEVHGVSRVDFFDQDEETSEVVLEGSRKGCMAAQKEILEVVDDLVNVSSHELAVPSFLHKDIIGSAGSRIKKVIDAFGGPDRVKVSFPPRGDSVVGGPGSNTVTLKAHTRDLDKLRVAVEKLISEVLTGDEPNAPKKHLLDESSNVTEDSATFPKSEVSKILGRGGDNVKEVMRKYNVNVWMGEVAEDEEVTDITIRVVGKDADSVKKALDDIKGRQRVSQTVAIPEKVLENLANAGAVHDTELASINDILRKVRAESSGAAFAEITGAATRGQAGSVITVKGDAKALTQAVATIEKGLAELTLYDVTVRLTIDPDMRPHIIGRAGATINRLRTDSGANLDINRGSEDRRGRGHQSHAKATVPDTLVIRGSTEAVEKATELVNKIIDDQKVRLVRDKERDEARARNAAEKTAAPTVAASHSGPARIDDDMQSDAGSSVVDGGIPGYSGKAPVGHGRRGKKSAVPMTSSSLVTGVVPVAQNTSASSYSVYSQASRPKEDEWKDVKSKFKKGDTAEAASVVGAPAEPTTVPGASEGGKKKKKKKSGKSGAAGGAEEEEAAPEPTPTPAPAPVAAAQPAKPTMKAAAPAAASQAAAKPAPAPQQAPKPPTAPAKAPAAPVAAVPEPETSKSKKKKAAKSSALDTSALSPALSVPATPAPTPAVSKPMPIPAPVVHEIPPEFLVPEDVDDFTPAPIDDGWTTVKSKGGAVAAPVAAPQSETAPAKKKKNKKKKKSKSGVGATADADDGEDDGDE
ncbi:hypothetical protein HK101_009570 [Irineochytrium annulatum]|nr:hypothetical protein HK101_009570 [Irineochytrium annulatum]